MDLYPLKFFPIYKNKIWGGDKLNTKLNRKLPGNKIGESWEVTTNQDSISVVRNGQLKGEKLTELIRKHPKNLLGDRYDKGDKFPLLLKIIDATQKLSVQVHPDDKAAEELASGSGKTEMWYVLDASKDAKLYIGLKDVKDKSQLKKAIQEGEFQEKLNAINVQRGDFFFIPAGTLHTIGGGLLLAEIQQNSDTTYRLYDWNRVDEDGNYRKLHLDKGLKATNLNASVDRYESIYKKETTDYKRKVLTVSKYFVTEKVSVKDTFKLDNDDFALLTCIENTGMIEYKNNTETLDLGESVMIPAGLKDVKIKGTGVEFLYIYIPEDVNYYIQKIKTKGFKSFNL